jgi:hypothetical protein
LDPENNKLHQQLDLLQQQGQKIKEKYQVKGSSLGQKETRMLAYPNLAMQRQIQQ